MSKLIIRLSQVSKAYHGHQAVERVSLTAEEGSLLVLLGHSGCGKTTTLRLLAGLETPDSGEIWIAGQMVAGPGCWVPPERRKVGMVFQDYALFPHLSVRANVAFAIPHLSGAQKRSRIAQMLELVGLSHHLDKFPHQLSGGEQQRVAIARALAPQPSVLLLDEPFSNLDAALRKRMREDVRAILKETGTTAVFVTHDQEEALSIADSITVIRAGRVQQSAPPDVLYRFPLTREVAEFIGDANFLQGEAQGDTVSCGIGQFPLPLCRAVRGTVDVLIRPEWIEVEPARDGEAEVLDRLYYGHDQLLLVRTRNGDLLRVRNRPDLIPEITGRVNLRVVHPVMAYPQRPAAQGGRPASPALAEAALASPAQAAAVLSAGSD